MWNWINPSNKVSKVAHKMCINGPKVVPNGLGIPIWAKGETRLTKSNLKCT